MPKGKKDPLIALELWDRLPRDETQGYMSWVRADRRYSPANVLGLSYYRGRAFRQINI